MRRRGRQTIPLAERFWSKVDKNGPVPAHMPKLGRCWQWTGSLVPDHGYATIRTGGRGSREIGVHRLAYEMVHGRILDSSLVVMHACDNRACCNPKHLSLGTHGDNAKDCAAKGREKDQRGSKHASTKLTEADVLAMREAWNRGSRLTELAARYSIQKSTASYIVNGRTWSHVPMPSNDSAKAVG